MQGDAYIAILISERGLVFLLFLLVLALVLSQPVQGAECWQHFGAVCLSVV